MQGSILNMTRSAASPKGGAALLIISFIRCCQCSNIKYWDSFSFKEQNEPTSTFSLSIWGSVGLWGFRTSNEQHQNDDRQYIRQHRKQLRRDIIHASQHHDQRLCKAKQQASPQCSVTSVGSVTVTSRFAAVWKVAATLVTASLTV